MSYSLAFSQAIKIALYIYIKTTLGKYQYLSTRSISDYLDIPVPSVSKILRSLIVAGLAQAKEGVHGGVVLTRAADQISLFDLFEAVENKTPLFKRDNRKDFDDPNVIKMVNEIDRSLMQAELAMKEELEKTSLQSLLKLYNL